MGNFPKVFLDRLREILPSQQFPNCLQSFFSERPVSVRINSLKIDYQQMIQILKDRAISFIPVPWYPMALILNNISRGEIRDWDLIQEGYLYLQGLSSMLPVLVLDPQANERVFDLCASPGSKTTQMASLMQNQGEIISVENIRSRYYKLKAVTSLLGVQNVSLRLTDGRKFSDSRMFDRILVDVPCSSEGRFKTSQEKSFAYWSLKKIKDMATKQKGLLWHASRFLKAQGILVYSTCTFAPEENEGVIDWFLKKTEETFRIEPIHLEGIQTYPPILKWNEKSFQHQIRDCVRILPTSQMEGFFMAKLVRVQSL